MKQLKYKVDFNDCQHPDAKSPTNLSLAFMQKDQKKTSKKSPDRHEHDDQ